MNCDVCGKDMTYPARDESIVSVNHYTALAISVPTPDRKEDEEYLKSQYGPYQVGRNYTACWECVLKAVGFKP